jgi:hypothetical protein
MEARTGLTPAERPTEWINAVLLLGAALWAWKTDHDTAALIAVAGATIPIIVTAVASWYDRRQVQPVAAPTVGTAPEGGE